ncbi:MAG: hypothetical protein Q4G33_04835 [bacterium]|nr:hypothetical protein [bacterium]
MDRITDEFKKGTPIKEIAKKIGISEVKVRRILITEGLWHSVTSDEIVKLVDEGLSTAEIADKLQKPLKTVQAYMPYSRGEYGLLQSYNAEQSKKFRERNREFAKKQPVRNEVMEMKKFDIWKEKTGYVGDGHKILKLHLELIADIDDEAEHILKKYGKMKRAISRDILAPADMRLHNLHYAIQRAFGWQNSHLHNFAYPDEVFSQLTDNKLTKWLDLCGIYFRFPDGDNEDLYWDDDYDGSVSPKTWFKRKYTGPYYYGGSCENYLYAATQAKAFKQQNPILRIGPSFEEFMTGKTDGKIAKIENVTTDESRRLFESGTDELLERLTIGEVLAASDYEGWKFKTERLIRDANGSFSDNYNKMRTFTDDYDIDRFCRETNPKVIPLSDRIMYSYDYGDGWQIEITCVDEYESFDRWNEPSEDGFVMVPITKEAIAENQHPIDKNGKEIEGELRDQLINVVVKHKPVCVSADGLPLLDDVGGIGGYCAFLLGVHGRECDAYDYNDKEETIEWGRGMGWNGRMNKPENIL